MSAPPADHEPPRTQAVVEKSRWPGWIWAVPIAAAAIAGWLLLREVLTSGIDVTVAFNDAAGIKGRDTKVRYRGVAIGSVSSFGLSKTGDRVIVHLDIDAAEKRDLNAGTRFYLEDATPSFSDPASLKGIVAGPTIVMVPGEGAPKRRFDGLVGEPPPSLAVAIPYLAKFSGDVAGLKPGAAVTLHGFTVGEVDDVRLSTDAASGSISAPAILLLDPTRFRLDVAPPRDGNWSPALNAALRALIAHGLRARLTQKPPLIGQEQVALDMMPDAGHASLRLGGHYPEIPTVAGGGIEHLLTAAGKLPLGEIGNNVEAISAQVRALVSSPRLRDSIAHLDHTVAELDRTLAAAGPQIAPAVRSARRTIDSLRKTASEIDATAEAIKRMTGGSATSPDGNLQQALLELSETSRAVRSLADFLDRHPEALLKGR